MYESSIAQHFAQRGREEGIQQGRMLSVLDFTSVRFGTNSAERLKPTLESIQDTVLLQQILVKVAEVDTFDELQQAVNALIS